MKQFTLFVLGVLVLLSAVSAQVAPKNMQICNSQDGLTSKFVEIGTTCPAGTIKGETTAYWDAVNEQRLHVAEVERRQRQPIEGFSEAAIRGAVLGGIFVLLISGWKLLVYLRKTFRNRINTARDFADLAYKKALDEVESGQIDKAIWARALVSGEGDASRANAAYISLRAKQIGRESH
jgi:hypothetical protein